MTVDTPTTTPANATPTPHRIAAIILAATALGLTWGIVLPQLARVDHVERQIERFEAAGVNPSALYWTDLEHDALWQPGSAWDTGPLTRPKR